MCAGYLLSIPFAVLTAAPAFGAALVRAGLCAVPEEIAPPPEIAALGETRPAHRDRSVREAA